MKLARPLVGRAGETDSSWPLAPWTEQMLHALGERGYSGPAWAEFLAGSWAKARDTARRERALVRAWQRLSGALLAATMLLTGLIWHVHGGARGRQVGGFLLIGLALQQTDIYVHLGLNRRLRDHVLLADLGGAIWLTSLRATTAQWLLMTTLCGVDIPGLAVSALVAGALTDTLDGAVARQQRHETKLGAYVDGEADVLLAISLTVAAVRRGTLPASAYWVMAARYALPIGVGLGVAFKTSHPPRLTHTLAGQLCGVVTAASLGSALGPSARSTQLERARRLLFPLAASLAVASGLAQVWRMLWGDAHARNLDTMGVSFSDDHVCR